MLLTWLMTALASLPLTNPSPAQSREPAEQSVPVYRVPGPAFEIPCKLTDHTPDLVAVQLWVSAGGGKSWQMEAEIKPDETKFEYHAKKPGEYAFAPRLKFKDGRVVPGVGGLMPTQRVAVEAGYELVTRAPGAMMAKVADDIDEELTRLEFELIRKEIRQLAEMKGFSTDTADKIDRMRSRLREAQQRLQQRDRDSRVNPVVIPEPPPPLPESRSNRHPSLIPPPSPPVPVSPAPREVR